MSTTITPTKYAPIGAPHCGKSHKWTLIGTHVVHNGSVKKKHAPRKVFREIREVYRCCAADHETFPCREVKVNIRYSEAIKEVGQPEETRKLESMMNLDRKAEKKAGLH